VEHGDLQHTEEGFTARRPVKHSRTRRLMLAGGAVVAAFVLGAGGLLGWQKLTRQSAKASIAPAPASATHNGQSQFNVPFGGTNPLPCSGDARPPITIKGHALPVCPPGA